MKNHLFKIAIIIIISSCSSSEKVKDYYKSPDFNVDNSTKMLFLPFVKDYNGEVQHRLTDLLSIDLKQEKEFNIVDFLDLKLSLDSNISIKHPITDDNLLKLNRDESIDVVFYMTVFYFHAPSRSYYDENENLTQSKGSQWKINSYGVRGVDCSTGKVVYVSQTNYCDELSFRGEMYYILKNIKKRMIEI